MKLFRKTTLALCMLPLIALTSCGGNGLANEKQVDMQTFTVSVADTASKNNNDYAVFTQKNLYSGLDPKIETYEYTYNKDSQKWISNSLLAPSIDHASEFASKIISIFTTLGIADYVINYFTADNGYRIYSDGSDLIRGIKSIIECVFNEAGFPTSFHQKTVSSVTGSEKTSETDTQIAYKTVKTVK